MVKEGYKQTEIGVIPEDWNIMLFQDCFRILPNNTLSRAELNDATGEIKNIHYGDILVRYGSVLECSKTEISYINNPKERLLTQLLQDGDIIIADTAEDETVGKAVEVTGIKNIKVVAGLHTIPCRAINPSSFAKGWLGYYLNHRIYHSQLLPFVTGTKVSAISKASILRTLILIPTISEQRYITEALSDIDELISSLEKLIAKKKAIKQGAMQQLLTGKTRLPGFTEKWNQNTFVELFDILPNNAYTRDQLSTGGTIKNIHYGDILTKYGAVLDGQSNFIPTLTPDLEKKKRSESQFIHSGDIIIADTAEDETVGKAVELNNVNCKILSGQHTFFCHPKIEFAPMFLGYYLNSTEFHAQMLPYITGTKVSSISKQSLNMLVIWYPSKEEQEAIAKILYEMDCEIEALGKKLEKVVQNKQGMMQQLLTGKIRLT